MVRQQPISNVRLNCVLGGLPTKRMAEIWCTLNIWEFPEELKAFEPKNWNGSKKIGRHSEVTPFMEYIQSTIGLKECLREWNKERIPGDHFDLWWEQNEAYVKRQTA
jgi:hypothetical protein